MKNHNIPCDRSVQYNILLRELDTSRQLYDGLLQRYKEVGVTGGVTANNVSLIDRAIAPKLGYCATSKS